MQISFNVDMGSYQAYQRLDDREKQSLRQIFNDFLTTRDLLKQQFITFSAPKRVAGSAVGHLHIADDFDEMPKNLSPIVANLLGCIDNVTDMDDSAIKQARYEEIYQKYLSLD